MADYSFTTIWYVAAPVEAVWEVLVAGERYPEWWPYVAEVATLEAGDATGVGARQRQTWRTALPYALAFETRATRVERPHRLEVAASGGLVGGGRWALTAEGPVTVVHYDWEVGTSAAWMNLLAPLARPFFAWNHRVVMEAGGVGLARRLGTQLARPSVHRVNDGRIDG